MNNFIRIEYTVFVWFSILQWFLLFRTSVYIEVESPIEPEEDCGRVPANYIIDNLDQDSGRGRVIIIRISIITYLHSHSKSITFFSNALRSPEKKKFAVNAISYIYIWLIWVSSEAQSVPNIGWRLTFFFWAVIDTDVHVVQPGYYFLQNSSEQVSNVFLSKLIIKINLHSTHFLIIAVINYADW